MQYDNVPSFIRAALEGSRPIQLTFADVNKNNVASVTSSFLYDPPGTGLKSTQQLNVDWSRFDRHTFFNSGVAKVNVAFDQVINGYPFDGSRREVEAFFEKLTGFERYVFDSFPKYRGELIFSGTRVGEDTNGTKGTFISVNDYAGGLYPEISKTRTGETTLNPKSNALSVEMQVFIPSISNDLQAVFQKASDATHGFQLFLQPSAGSTVFAHWSIVSGTNSLEVSGSLKKGQFNHICLVYDTDGAQNRIARFYIDSNLIGTSLVTHTMGDLPIDASPFTIGTGSAITITLNGTTGPRTLTPTQTFSGTIDEFRVFHSFRSEEQQAQYAQKAIYASPDLKLYYRFNEPNPPLSPDAGDVVNSIILDSSGNSLHSTIANFTGSLRYDASADVFSPMIYEKASTAPVLFPSHPGVIALNSTLLSSASQYDAVNPNLITRLIPQHYFLEGQLFDGLKTVEGTLNDPYGGGAVLPSGGKIGSTQLILSFLYVWARFFDEMKLYVDAFSNINYVDYDNFETAPDNFLLQILKQFGFTLPPILFNDASIEQFIDAENINFDISTNELPLKYVQNQLIRRVLINLPDVLKAKGTQHSIKSFLRSIGIDPDKSVKIREYGGPSIQQLDFSRENRRDSVILTQLLPSSLVISHLLSGSRTEVGFPSPTGAFLNKEQFHPHGISNQINDGLLTSGSWTIELNVKYPLGTFNVTTSVTESLIRLHTTGSISTSGALVSNLLAKSDDLRFHMRPGAGGGTNVDHQISTSGSVNVFDGDMWHIAMGRERGDKLGFPDNSSRYFLLAGKLENGVVKNYVSVNDDVIEAQDTLHNVLQLVSTLNTSGAYLAVGSQSIDAGTALGTYFCLNNTLGAPDEARTVNFSGLISDVRFWSKALSADEFKEHVRNPASIGVENPLSNFNFVTSVTGSFERLRLESLRKQSVSAADNVGDVQFLDFSGNDYHMLGTGFTPNASFTSGHLTETSYWSPRFDESSSDQKIRIRGLQDPNNVEHSWEGLGPAYEVPKQEQPSDDVRFSVEFSLIDALNRDIINIFASLDAFDNALGNPELAFSPDYPDLEQMRQVYFNRLVNHLDFKAFFEFFRWFDTSVGNFIEQLLPRKTTFKGTSFVVESHVLERAKLEYFSNEIYLHDEDRSRIRDTLLLQQIVGSIRKW